MIYFFGNPAQSLYAVQTSQNLDATTQEKLVWLFGNQTSIDQENVEGSFVGPRATMITPWSTNAVEITQNMDIKGISKTFEEDRIHIEIGDAAKPRFLKRVFRTYQPSVILDDASHFWSHQIIGFQTLFPLLPPGGVYIVEDVHTSFLAKEEGAQYADHEESFWSYFSRLQAALVCAQRHGPELSLQESRLVAWIDSISISRRTVAIVKRQKMRRREVVQTNSEPES
mgnify:CR=1 FL=1